MSLVTFLDKKVYSKFEKGWDDIMLREFLLEYIDKDKTVLDIGAGAGIVSQMDFKNLAKKVVGVDPDPRVKENPYLHEAHIGLGDDMSYLEDDTFDIVFCDNVLEHIDNPTKFYAEVSRVLKKGGVFLAKTPNKYHYMPLVASLTPTSFHKYYNKKRGRDADDTFPTRYKANTRKDQKKWAEQSGMRLIKSNLVEGRPEYLRITFLTYLVGIVYEKLVNGLGLHGLKVVMFTVCEKQ